MDFNNIGSIICGEEIPSFLGVFDLSVAPSLLFYSYIPIIIASLLIGFFIYLKDKKSLQSTLLLSVVIFFTFWIFNVLIQWIASYHTILMFAWQMTAIFEVGLFLLTIYFAHVFINKKDLPFLGKIVLVSLGLAVIFLTPTKFNISSYDLQNCEGVVGQLWNLIYIFEPAVIVTIIYIGFSAFRKETIQSAKNQIIMFTTGLAFFLTTFFISNFYGELTRIYEFNLWGPVGMLVFFILLMYMIVRYKAFNIKLIATQAFIWGLVILIGSQFFFIKVSINFILNSFTFIASIIFGYLLIKSVKKEVSQKEELSKLNRELNESIKQRESLVHLVTHKVKGSFTRSKYIFAGIVDGTFGEVNEEVKKYAAQGLESDNMGIETVDLVLNADNLQKGAVKYDMKTLDMKEVVEKTLLEKKIQAEARGLKIESEVKDGEYHVLGDAFWLKEAINNLIENSIKYTKHGEIKMGLEDGNGKVRFYVKDTGVGITEEDKKNLFTEGGRGKNSVKVNVDSTGYGLYSVKLIIDAHKGKVWGESEGEGKGSTFYIELEAVK